MARLRRAYPWLTLALFGLGVAAYSSVEPIAAPRTALPVPSVAGQERFKIRDAHFVGATSCAAASCHGGTSGPYATWAGYNPETNRARDPHAKAYRVLFNEVSQQIADSLAGSNGGRIIPAHENSLCLKCHAQTAERVPNHPSQSLGHDAIVDRSVGCESCHGPAEHYLSTHYLNENLALSPREKAAKTGLYPTKDLSFRVQLCASCHIGDASREVNHDLIAAGHPRLMFEYTSFHHHPEYQRHWQEKGKDFNVRSWALGQAGNIRSAVETLRARAELAKQNAAPWPELAEYSCYACHKDLAPGRASWKSVTDSKTPPGLPAWGTWTLPTLGALKSFSKPPLDDLRQLRILMEQRSPNAGEVFDQCGKTLVKLDSWIEALQAAPEGSLPDPAFILKALSANALFGDRLNDIEWDGAKQHYLGMHAAARSWDNEQIHAWIEKLRVELSFPPKQNSPSTAQPDTIRDLFQSLRKMTHEGRAE